MPPLCWVHHFMTGLKAQFVLYSNNLFNILYYFWVPWRSVSTDYSFLLRMGHIFLFLLMLSNFVGSCPWHCECYVVMALDCVIVLSREFTLFVLVDNLLSCIQNANSVFWATASISVQSIHPLLVCLQSTWHMYHSRADRDSKFIQRIWVLSPCLRFFPFCDSPEWIF